MFLEAFLLIFAAAAPEEPATAMHAPLAAALKLPAPDYRPDERAVSNWRIERALSLETSPASALLQLVSPDADDPPRCVKLNNYWCVKRAGWNGEIASDAEGHVAFSSALEGAAVAALLLRRYYVDYKKHSARAIVARWAPANCLPGGLPPGAPLADSGTPPLSRAGMARMMPQRPTPMGVAPQGIENTLRARWLSAYGRGGGPGWTVSALAGKPQTKALELMRAPTIAAGMGEPAAPAPAAEAPRAITGRKADAGGAPPAAGLGLGACPGEIARIQNYAAKVAAGVAKTPDEDLRLFTPAGEPTPSLARVMANMAAVEIGPEKAAAPLIDAAISQLRETLAAQAAKPGLEAPLPR
jgi:hypothetical protein